MKANQKQWLTEFFMYMGVAFIMSICSITLLNLLLNYIGPFSWLFKPLSEIQIYELLVLMSLGHFIRAITRNLN